MKCSWFIRSLRLAVLGGVGIACSLTGARLGNAAVVGADVPSWMASLRTLNLYDYRTTWEGDSWEQPSPWLDPDEGYSYGGYYEASEYRPYAEESTATETPAYGESIAATTTTTTAIATVIRTSRPPRPTTARPTPATRATTRAVTPSR